MKKVAILASVSVVIALAGSALSQRDRGVVGPRPKTVERPRDECGPRREVVEIRDADPLVNEVRHNLMRDLFIRKAYQPDTTILLGPNVVLDFSKLERRDWNVEGVQIAIPIIIGRCVTIRSVAWFGPSPADVRIRPDGVVLARDLSPPASSPKAKWAAVARRRLGTTVPPMGDLPTTVLGDPSVLRPVPEARSSRALGPLLKFGPHRESGDNVFVEIRCYKNQLDQADHVRISGFRIYGPDLGQQTDGDKGILINKCIDVEISNMEIAGFGGEGIRVQDDTNEYFDPEILADFWQLRGIDGVCREPPYNGTNGRIGSPDQVRIIGNYIHNNQHPTDSLIDGHAGGYGVQVTDGAHARISQNLFSTNRHAIAGGGTMAGYEATQNLVLRYGGVHYDGWPLTTYTHQFDIHGTGDNGFRGWAGARTTYSHNAFQFRRDNAIKIRGSPRCGIEISNNVFPHPGLENEDEFDDAVALQYRQDIGAIRLGPNNKLNKQTYGQYEVCDFDGDGLDDLFLATGVSWWFSGMGEFPWQFLSLRNEELNQLRLGYFDADNKCDVLTESNNAWMISSGGTGQWHRLSQEYAPLSQVAFGRFDLTRRDHRPGVTRRTTHAFWRTSSGQWKITTLTGTDQGWKDIARSDKPMSDLQFGDFDGDGVTDVLAKADGRWAMSSGGARPWSRINPELGNDVSELYIADINANNKDDVIRVTYRSVPAGQSRVLDEFEWEISYDGATRWMPLRSYRWLTFGTSAMRPFTFVGRFGMAPGAGILTLDRDGVGQFYAPLESRLGNKPDWTSTFSY